MGPRTRNGMAFPGVGPTLPLRVGRERGEAYRKDPSGVWRARRRWEGGGKFGSTSTTPARSRKHRRRS